MLLARQDFLTVPVEEWVLRHCGQIAVLGLSIVNTQQVQEALRDGSEKALQALKVVVHSILLLNLTLRAFSNGWCDS
jgi:hypothetical protein